LLPELKKKNINLKEMKLNTTITMLLEKIFFNECFYFYFTLYNYQLLELLLA